VIARAALGAVVGTILGLMLDPIVAAIPQVPLLTEFVDSLASEVLTFAFAIGGAAWLSRVPRLDHAVAKHLPRLAPLAAGLLALSFWLNAGRPRSLMVYVSLMAIAGMTALLLAFCGWLMISSMQEFTVDQQGQAAARREKEAQGIAERSIAMGDPQIAVGVFSLDLAGRVGQAYALACLGLVVLPPLTLAILTTGALAAHFLYGLPWPWAVVTAFVVGGAVVAVLGLSEEVGKAHAHQVPLEEKYKEILHSEPADES
jgi:hypothetical protein